MAQYIYSGRSRPCPICGRTKDQDCRWNQEVVFCHTHVDQDGAVDGYVYRGATADGMWGQYFAATASPEKPVRPQQRQDYFYPSRAGQPLVKVTRVDRGNGAKFFVQYHWNGQQWIKGLTSEIRAQVPIYRYRDIQNAISIGQPVWMVEGEGCADALWAIGIPSTTTLGGSKKYRSYGDYRQDLQDANLVLCPDRDQVGIAHMEEVAQDCPSAQWCYPYPDSLRWQNLPKHGGLDVVDWIHDGATAEQIRAAVQDLRQLEVSPTQDPERLSVQALQDQIRTYLGNSPTELALAAQVVQWHQETGISARDIGNLVTLVQAELEQTEERDDSPIGEATPTPG